MFHCYLYYSYISVSFKGRREQHCSIKLFKIDIKIKKKLIRPIQRAIHVESTFTRTIVYLAIRHLNCHPYPHTLSRLSFPSTDPLSRIMNNFNHVLSQIFYCFLEYISYSQSSKAAHPQFIRIGLSASAGNVTTSNVFKFVIIEFSKCPRCWITSFHPLCKNVDVVFPYF